MTIRRSRNKLVTGVATLMLATLAITAPSMAQGVTTEDLDANGGYFCTPADAAQTPPKCNHPGTYACYLDGCVLANAPTTTADPNASTTTSSSTTTILDDAPPEGTATITTNGPTVTVSVTGEVGATVTVVDAGGTAIASGVVGSDGTVTINVDLSAGSYALTVSLSDAAGNGQVIHAETVDVIGPAPNAPSVVISGGTLADELTHVSVCGPVGVQWNVDISKDGEVAESDFGSVGEGTLEECGGPGAVASILLGNGEWSYEAKLVNDTGESPASAAPFTVAIPAPGPPEIEMRNSDTRREGSEGTPGSPGPLTLDISGPIDGTIEVTATPATGEAVTNTTDLGSDGSGVATLDVVDGEWTITATATDFQGQVSEPSPALTWAVDTTAPILGLKDLEAPEGEVSYEITTEIGVRLEIQSATAALQETVAATTEEVLTRTVSVGSGNHSVVVVAFDGFENRTEQTLFFGDEADAGESSSSSALPFVIGAIVIAFVGTAVWKRQDIIDWWYNRGYH